MRQSSYLLIKQHLDRIEAKLDRVIALGELYMRRPDDPRGPVNPPLFQPTLPPAPAVSDRLRELAARPGMDMMGLIFNLGRPLTDDERAYLRSINFPGSQPVDGSANAGRSDFDRNLARDLTGTNGNWVRVEGIAGSRFRFECREPPGRKLEFATGLQSSALGQAHSVTLEFQGRTATGGANGEAYIGGVSTGNDPLFVTLNQAGAVSVQLNPS